MHSRFVVSIACMCLYPSCVMQISVWCARHVPFCGHHGRRTALSAHSWSCTRTLLLQWRQRWRCAARRERVRQSDGCQCGRRACRQGGVWHNMNVFVALASDGASPMPIFNSVLACVFVQTIIYASFNSVSLNACLHLALVRGHAKFDALLCIGAARLLHYLERLLA